MFLRPLHRVRQLARMLLGSVAWIRQRIAGPVCLLLAKSALAHRKHGRCEPLRQARATNFSLQTVSSSACRLQKHYNRPPQLSQLMSSQIKCFRASCTQIPNSSEQPSNSANLFETSSCGIQKHFFVEPWDGGFPKLGFGVLGVGFRVDKVHFYAPNTRCRATLGKTHVASEGHEQPGRSWIKVGAYTETAFVSSSSMGSEYSQDVYSKMGVFYSIKAESTSAMTQNLWLVGWTP